MGKGASWAKGEQQHMKTHPQLLQAQTEHGRSSSTADSASAPAPGSTPPCFSRARDILFMLLAPSADAERLQPDATRRIVTLDAVLNIEQQKALVGAMVAALRAPSDAALNPAVSLPMRSDIAAALETAAAAKAPAHPAGVAAASHVLQALSDPEMANMRVLARAVSVQLSRQPSLPLAPMPHAGPLALGPLQAGHPAPPPAALQPGQQPPTGMYCAA